MTEVGLEFTIEEKIRQEEEKINDRDKDDGKEGDGLFAWEPSEGAQERFGKAQQVEENRNTLTEEKGAGHAQRDEAVEHEHLPCRNKKRKDDEQECQPVRDFLDVGQLTVNVVVLFLDDPDIGGKIKDTRQNGKEEIANEDKNGDIWSFHVFTPNVLRMHSGITIRIHICFIFLGINYFFFFQLLFQPPDLAFLFVNDMVQIRNLLKPLF